MVLVFQGSLSVRAQEVKLGNVDGLAPLPNILFILADDLGYADLGCQAKEPDVRTPHLDRFAKENSVAAAKLSPEALAVLVRYPWPGNIRELRNACENLAVLRSGKTVAAGDLDARFSQLAATTMAVSALPSAGGNILDREQNEKQLLKQALAAAAGNRTRAAELMGISRRTLHRKLLQWPELDPGPETA